MSGDGGRQIPAPVVATADGWKSLQQAPLRPIRKLPEMAPRTAADLPTCSPRLQRVSRTHYATHTTRSRPDQVADAYNPLHMRKR
jgi:hypothetical protein